MASERSMTSTTTRSRPATGGSASQPVQQVTQTAQQTVAQATDTAKQQANRQLDKVSDGLEQVAQTLYQAGESLRENNQATVGSYVDKAAGQVERASTYVRVRSVEEIIEDVQAYARREPVVTIGVALGIGFIGARLLKASLGRVNPEGVNDGARYRTPAYYADRTNSTMRTANGVTRSSASRYGDGA